ncbi:hypothetical protein [Mucilaginibacter defluvii]|uniref:Uncharacterized protein n=1 Tax=Mucilaginibacter defluvii TaxID=1196019 RepID=A0ABP9FW23_9SPHI
MAGSNQNSDNLEKEFIELVKHSRRGKLKVYIDMSAGVDKIYRMLQEAMCC